MGPFSVSSFGSLRAPLVAGCAFTLSSMASAAPPVPPAKPGAPWASKAAPSAKPAVAPKKGDAVAKFNATKLLNEGLLALKRNEYADALEKFRAAYALFPSAKLLLNIGTSQRYLGRHAEAATTYERYLADPEAAPERVREVEKILDTVMREVAVLVIEPSVPSAAIAIDGEPLAATNGVLRVRLNPGAHTLTAKATGDFLDTIETLTVGAGERRTIPFTMKRKPLPEDGSKQRVVGFAVGGVGLAALGGGVLLGVLANKSNAAAAPHCVTDILCDGEGARLGDRAHTQALGATIAFAAGGAALATGLVLVFTAPGRPPADEEAPAAARRREPPSASWQLAVGAKGAELLVRW